MTEQSNKRKNWGFARLDQESMREIARKGGQAAHSLGRAHRFTAEEARAAGKKGGLARSRNLAADRGLLLGQTLHATDFTDSTQSY